MERMEKNGILNESEKNWGMFCHLSAFAGFLFPLGGVLGPVIFWMSRKDDSQWIDINGKASINFQLSIILYIILCIPLVFIVVGVFLIGAIMFLNILAIVIASIRAANGQLFTYPLSIPFIQ